MLVRGDARSCSRTKLLAFTKKNTFNRLKHICGTVFNTFTDRQTGRRTNRQIYKTPKEYEDVVCDLEIFPIRIWNTSRNFCMHDNTIVLTRICEREGRTLNISFFFLLFYLFSYLFPSLSLSGTVKTWWINQKKWLSRAQFLLKDLQCDLDRAGDIQPRICRLQKYADTLDSRDLSYDLFSKTW